MTKVITEISTASPQDRWSIARLIREASKYESVLDIGCGVGKVIKKIKSKTRYGIDACLIALNVARKQNNNGVKFIHLDLIDVIQGVKKFPSVECIIGVDIIEHFTKQDAIQLILTCEGHTSKRIIFFIPVGNHPQTKDDRGFKNDHYQTHRSTWYPEDMERLGYDVWLYPNWHSRVKPPKEKGAMWCQKIL